MTIHIEDLKFKCIIGLLDFERTNEQEVIINLNLDYDYKDEFINYADLAKLIQKQLINEKYELLETALEELFQNISKKYLLIRKLQIKITKPNILSNCLVSVSNIKIY